MLAEGDINAVVGLREWVWAPAGGFYSLGGFADIGDTRTIMADEGANGALRNCKGAWTRLRECRSRRSMIEYGLWWSIGDVDGYR
jgi:hypothetical protein